MNFIEFSKELEDSTGWKPTEKDALEKLLETIEHTNKELFNNLKSVIFFPEENPEKYYKITANFIYKLRNNIVHFRPINEEENYEDTKWNIILEFCLNVVIYLHYNYKDYLRF
jgi:hypothetical protein